MIKLGYAYHIIFMDLHMVVMDGEQCTKHIRKMEQQKILPKSTKFGAKNHQVGDKNLLKSVPWGVLEGSGVHLGPSGPHEAPRHLQRASQEN